MKKLLILIAIKAILPEILDMIWKAGHKLANKTDTEPWELNENIIKNYAANKGFPLFMTSAKENQKVEDAFNCLATEITGTVIKIDPH